MSGLRYYEDVQSLTFEAEKCTGCKMCTMVCPFGVFEMRDKRAVLVDKGACIECGACDRNCSANAIHVKAGVGCAEAIIKGWINGTEPSCDCMDC